jgi:hypothetical protein
VSTTGGAVSTLTGAARVVSGATVVVVSIVVVGAKVVVGATVVVTCITVVVVSGTVVSGKVVEGATVSSVACNTGGGAGSVVLVDEVVVGGTVVVVDSVVVVGSTVVDVVVGDPPVQDSESRSHRSNSAGRENAAIDLPEVADTDTVVSQHDPSIGFPSVVPSVYVTVISASPFLAPATNWNP